MAQSTSVKVRILMLLLATGCPAKPAEAPPPRDAGVRESPAIVFLGDSLTAGRGLAEADAVPAKIAERVEAAGFDYRVINAGRSGDTTAGGLTRLNWYLRDTVRLKVLVIGLGSNDAMRGQPIDSIESNLEKIVDATRAKVPDAKILLWSMKTFPNMGEAYREDYEEVFARVAASKKITLIPFPLADVAGRPELNQPDGIHPTKAGTALVAERIWATLKRVL